MQPAWKKQYPKNIDWDGPIHMGPLYEILDEAAKRFPNNKALTFEGRSWRYKELLDEVNKAAKGFQDLGVKKGTKVALCLPNSPYYLISYYAILKAGGVVVNMNPLYSSDEMKHLLKDSQAEMVVAIDQKEIANNVYKAAEEAGVKTKIHCPVADALPWWKGLLYPLVRGGEVYKKARQQKCDKNFIKFDKLLKNKGNYTPIPVKPFDDVALIQYTGGTTGLPKGAMLTHANLSANADQSSAWFPGVEPGKDKMLAVIPFFHVFAMTVAMNLSIRNGLEIIAKPKFDLDDTLKTIQKEKPTLFPAVPAIYAGIANAKQAKKYNLSSIKFCLSGGAPLPDAVRETFESMTGCRLVEGYGLTESSPVVVCNPTDGKVKPGSIGLPLPKTVIELRDPETGELIKEFNKKGELCIRGPQVMKGYFNNKAATWDSLRHGLLRTGDIAVMDEDGYFYIVDRIKDMVISYGFNIYPREVEDAIYKHEAIEECIVAGLPDEKRGERVVAWIKLKEGQRLEAAELKDFLKDKLIHYKLPKEIHFEREPLPKTLIGKLSRKDMLALHLKRSSVKAAPKRRPKVA